MPILDINNTEEMEKYKKFLNSIFDVHFIQDPRWSKVHNNLKTEYVTVKDENGDIIASAAVYIRPIVLGHSLLYINRGPVCKTPTLEIVRRFLEELKPLLCKKSNHDNATKRKQCLGNTEKVY